MTTYLLSTNDDNASWTVNGHQGPWQGTKPASGEIANWSYSYSYSYFLFFSLKSLFDDSSFMDVVTCL